jgi:carboxypeptidase T
MISIKLIFTLILYSFLATDIRILNTSEAQAAVQKDDVFWIKIPAKDKYERTKIANLGLAIDYVAEDYVISFGRQYEIKQLEAAGFSMQTFKYDSKSMDFPADDADFHNYAELKEAIRKMQASHPEIVTSEVIGKSIEGRDIIAISITSDIKNASTKPAILFLGSHHAREHLSTEVPLMLAQHLVTRYAEGDEKIRTLVDSRHIIIVPLVNPDGSEFDISSGSYEMWRKNRRDNGDENFGVDLNRNYDMRWGQGGSSSFTGSEVYMGSAPFSEPETQAIRDFVEGHPNITVLLSFHTFSKLVMYPWGGTFDELENKTHLAAFQKMAATMASWNGYTAQKSSELYIATGDTCDWAYGKHGIFAFTFELDPGSIFEGGFYPGQKMIVPVFQKNLEAALYLIGLADNPLRAAEPQLRYGLRTPLLR